MAVYLVTFKSGAQQFVEMDMDDAHRLTYEMGEYAKWEDLGRRGGEAQLPPRIFASDTGATLDVSTVAGFQHYITPRYAAFRADEDEDIPAFNDSTRKAMDAAIQAMMDTAEVEGNEPNGYVAAVDREAVMVAFLTALEDS